MTEYLICAFLSAAGATVVHEAGHITASMLCGHRVNRPRTVMGGLSMKMSGTVSYGETLFIAAGGAVFNLILALLLLPFPSLSLFCRFSFGTAIYNLIPLPGTDGEMMLLSILSWKIKRCDAPMTAVRITRVVCDIFLALFFVLVIYINAVGIGDGAALLLALVFMLMRKTAE